MAGKEVTFAKAKNIENVPRKDSQLIFISDPEEKMGLIYFDFSTTLRLPLGYIDPEAYTNDDIDDLIEKASNVVDEKFTLLLDELNEKINNIPKGHTAVFNPGGVNVANIFNTFAGLCKYLVSLSHTEEITVFFLPSGPHSSNTNIPSGTYVLPPIMCFKGIGDVPDDFHNLCAGDGVVLKGLKKLTLSGVDLICSKSGSASLFKVDGTFFNLVIDEGTVFVQQEAPLIELVNQARLKIDVINGSLVSANAPIIKFDASSAQQDFRINVGSGGTIKGKLIDDTGIVPVNQNIYAHVGAVIGEEFADITIWSAKADQINYNSGDTGLTAKNVQEAIDILQQSYISLESDTPNHRNTKLWMPKPQSSGRPGRPGRPGRN